MKFDPNSDLRLMYALIDMPLYIFKFFFELVYRYLKIRKLENSNISSLILEKGQINTGVIVCF